MKRHRMSRREILAGLGALPATLPLTVRAQSAAMPVAGFLFSEPEGTAAYRAESFRQGLKEAGFVEGRNVTVAYRWGNGRKDRLPGLVAELTALNVAVICAGNLNSALAAKASGTPTPMVFLTAGDPVEDGLVASFSRPGGNATGVRIFSAGLVAKRAVELGLNSKPWVFESISSQINSAFMRKERGVT